ncbi:MAG: tetratricopeptide repeat protein [Planctomycetota bacterium]
MSTSDKPTARSARWRDRRYCWLLIAAASLALSGVTGATWAADVETVGLVLIDGQTLEGRVVDLRTNQLELTRRLGSRTIPKRDVMRWSLNPPKEDAPQHPILMLKEGREVTGELEFDGLKGAWVVKFSRGVGSYPAAEVLRVIQTSGLGSDGTFTPRRDFPERLASAIALVRSDDGESQKRGTEALEQLGFFALAGVEAAIKQDGDSGGRLVRFVSLERLRVALPTAEGIDSAALLQTLTRGSEIARLEALRRVVLDVSDGVYPLLTALLLDRSQPPAVRAYAVDVLRVGHRIQDLVDIYRQAQGESQLAIAIALGDAGIYIGLNTLIEALNVDDVEVQRLALMKLEEYTGERFDCDPAASAELKLAAVNRWHAWWQEHRSRSESALAYHLNRKDENPHRVRASEYFRQGNMLWSDGSIAAAEELFRKAIDEDPSCLPPFVSLGIIAYQVRSDPAAATEWFRRALRRVPLEGEESILRLAYYHLGRIFVLGRDYESAIPTFQRAIDLDPNYADAWLELGHAKFHGALYSPSLSVAERTEQCRDAIRVFQDGSDRLRKFREGLTLLDSTQLPIGSDLPFSAHAHNKSLKDLREKLAASETEFFHRLALVYFAIHEREAARDWAKKAIEGPKPTVEQLVLYSQILAELGQQAESAKFFNRARELNPDHPLVKKSE